MATRTQKSTAVAKTNGGAGPLQRLHQKLTHLMPQMVKQMAKGIDPEHQIGAAVAIAKASPRLQQCSIASLVDAIYMANRQGLNLHPQLKHAYLVPFNKRKKVGNKWIDSYEAVLIVDFRGLIYAATQQGLIKDADVVMVREGDDFRHGKRIIGGRNESYLEWEPAATVARGDITHGIALFTMPDGFVKYRVMDVDRIEAIRKAAPSARGKSSPWDDHYGEMASKTVLKWGFKLIPQGVQFAELIASDNVSEGYKEVAYREGEVIEMDTPPEQIESEPSEAATLDTSGAASETELPDNLPGSDVPPEWVEDASRI